GVDAIRLVFRGVDKFGAPRVFAGGDVRFEVTGPGILVGDNPFLLTESGGSGAVWVKARPESSGRTTGKATHSTLGAKAVMIEERPDLRAINAFNQYV